MVHERLELLRADDAGDRRQVGGRPGHALGGPRRRTSATASCTAPNGERIYVSYRNRYGRRRSYMTTFEGIVPNLERRYRETDSDWSREKIEEYMTLRPVPGVQGARLRPESLAVQGRRARHPRVHAHVGARARSSGSRQLELSETERQIARLILREIDERLRFLDNVGRRLPDARAGGGHAVGRRGAADPAGHADRLAPGGRALHPRRALDRPAPARQRAADRHARAAARPRQHRDRGRARRGHDARGRPPGRPRARAPASTAARWWPRARPSEVMRVQGVAHRASTCRASAQIPVPTKRRRPDGLHRDRGRAQHNLQEHRREGPAGRVLLRDRRVRLGQVHARQRGALQGGRQPAAPREAAARARTGGSAGSTRSTRSSTSTSRRSGARRARTRPPTSGCSTTSASSTRARRRRGRAATSRAASRST